MRNEQITKLTRPPVFVKKEGTFTPSVLITQVHILFMTSFYS